jgi:phosphoglycerate dehydrogenase-like enzyme
MTTVVLAGFIKDQVEELTRTFPLAKFRIFQSDESHDYQADAVIAVHRSAFDAVFDSGLLKTCKGLRWVHIPAAGIENYFGPELQNLPYTLTNGKIIQGPEVADHAMALLLSLTRRIVHVARGIPRASIPHPTELHGKTAVIIGGGGIGMGIAERVHSFGMSVIVVTETNLPVVSFIHERVFADKLLEALPRADAVFVAAPLTTSTRKMLDRQALEVMKPAAYLINVSRGAIIDTDALVEVLEGKHLSGVGLDVTDPEPLPSDHPLRKFDNVIISPHIAGMSDGFGRRNMELIATNIRRFLSNHPLINVVDRTLGY